MSARVTYVGHAETLIELAGERLLTDPVRRGRLLGVIRRAVPLPDPETAHRLSAVLISHLHSDHLDFHSLRMIPGPLRLIVPAGGARLLRREGFERVLELEPGDWVNVGGVRVMATPAVHDGRRWKVGRRVPALGYELSGAGRRIYFAGDTDLFPGMAELAGEDHDLALLPISGWGGPRTTAGHLDPRRAAEAAALMRPRVVVPIHWGTLKRSDELRRRPALLRTPPLELAEHLHELAPDVELRVLQPGATTELG